MFITFQSEPDNREDNMFCLAEHIVALRKYVGAFKSAFFIAGGGPRSDMALTMLSSFMDEVDACYALMESTAPALGRSPVVVDEQLIGVTFAQRVDALPDLAAPVVQQVTLAARALASQSQADRAAPPPVPLQHRMAYTAELTAGAIVLQASAFERMAAVLPVFFRAGWVAHM